MDAEQLRQDVAAGTVSLDRLVELIASQQKLIEQQQAQIEQLIEQLGKNPTERLDESYSEKAEEKRKADAQEKPKKRRKPKRSGRITTAGKIARASRTESAFPDGCDPAKCKVSHTRVAWRLDDGRAGLITYDIYSLPDGDLVCSSKPVESGVLRVVFLNDSQHCLILRGRHRGAAPKAEQDLRAFVISAVDAQLLGEHRLDSRDLEIRSVSTSRTEPVVFIATRNWIGRCQLQSNQVKFDVFVEMVADVLEYHTGSHRLAVATTLLGSSTKSYIVFLNVLTGSLYDRHIETSTLVHDIVFGNGGNVLYAPGSDPSYSYSTGVVEQYDLSDLK